MTKELFYPEQATDGTLLKELMTQYYGKLPFEGDTFSAVPVVVKPQYLAQMDRLCRVLNRALVNIVSAYFSDERIRAIYDLDEEMEGILRVAAEKPYTVGLYRPDLLQDESGQARICEIGARYPINGWMISYYLNLICRNSEVMPRKELQAVPGQLEFLQTLYDTFEANQPVILVHDNEKGTEVFNLLNEFDKKGLSSLSASSTDLKLHNGQVTLNNKAVSQFILEMDREELRKFSPDVLHHIIRNGIYFNDVRTLILVHDKRVLAALYDESIMADHLSEEDYLFLRPFLIPTFTLSETAKREEVIHSKQNWLLKQNSGGRGIDIYVKDECTPQAWADVVDNRWPEYMVQQYVQQQQFDYMQSPGINIVGMLLCYNDRSFGPGLFRGAAGCVVNVHNGRAVIFSPMALKA
ncbi:hypothetical protein [Mucilaginibacter aquariorum]|uniref:Glutathionylspermidine synthase pre-ATP-grasp-like domain-containing protein n=1 Tax=Mucilaginibacter aquariorum TaxID=2967225 RepID=A0ABT1SZK6_9SPHI|nr:hypothetical protein [Mucilaginibacter aquariorum]MCQ6957764.1 hypothetical protein [Mucilaginibacter aquariorum]